MLNNSPGEKTLLTGSFIIRATRRDSGSTGTAQRNVYFASRRAGPPGFRNNIFANNPQSARASNLVYSILDRLRMVNRDRPVGGNVRFADRETRIAQSAIFNAAESENELAKTDSQRMIAA